MALFLLALFPGVFSLSCLDASGTPQDYFAMLKAPEAAQVPPLPGKTYMYLDSSNLSPSWMPQPLNVTSPLTYTLNQFNTNSSISYVVYNDCIPPNCSANYSYYTGHSKGILAYTSTEAIYIIHSYDQFPTVSATGQFTLDIENPEMMYGQHMFCVTMSPSSLFNMAGVMSINYPQVYASKVLIPNSNITLLIQNNSISSAKSYSYNFTTLGGLPMTYFAKSPLANVDLYESIVSPFYNDGMILETWGRPWESDFCPPTYTYKNVNADEISIGKYWWTSYYDHAKWGIGMTTNLLCYSDINRMYSQWVRGGGCVCTVNAALYKVHKGFIEKYDSC